MFKVCFPLCAVDAFWRNSLLCFKNKKIKAFTLAEVLITVMIIGIVAAISIPSLVENVSERIWESQRKVLHLRLAEALAMLPKLNGYGTDKDDAAASFLTEGLASVYKMGGVCLDNDDLEKCGLPSTFTSLNGTSYSFPTTLSDFNYSGGSYSSTKVSGTTTRSSITISDTAAAAFKTVNGESIAVFYNPDCTSYVAPSSSTITLIAEKACVNFIYDLNGSEGPNKVGKDIGFITAFYRKNPSVVAPVIYPEAAGSGLFEDGLEACSDVDEDLRLPDKEEAASIWYNAKLLDLDYSDCFWTGTPISASRAFSVCSGGQLGWEDISINYGFEYWCVYN